MKDITKNANRTTPEKISKLKEKFTLQIEKNEIQIIKIQEKLDHLISKRNKGENVSVKRLVSLSNKEFKLKTKNKRLAIEINELDEDGYEIPGLFESIKIKFSKIENTKQRYIWGLIFIIPWVIGMALFFLPSFIKTILWSFNDLNVRAGVVTSKFVGLSNFKKLFSGYVVEGGRIF